MWISHKSFSPIGWESTTVAQSKVNRQPALSKNRGSAGRGRGQRESMGRFEGLAPLAREVSPSLFDSDCGNAKTSSLSSPSGQ